MSRKTKRIKDFSKVGWKKLKDKDARVSSLEILRLMRKGFSLTKTSEKSRLDVDIVKQHIFSAIFKRKGRWRAKKKDFIERGLTFYEDGESKTIIVSNSERASLIGRYLNDVKKALETGNDKILKKYKRRVIRDAKGKKHKLEIRLEKVREIEEAKEEPEFFAVYRL